MKPNLLILCGALGVAVFCIAHGGSADVPAEAPAVLRPEPSLVDRFDQTVQDRFQDLRAKDIEEGRLGFGRMVNIVSIHGPIFRPGTPRESRAVEDLQSAGWTPTVFVASIPSDSQAPPRIRGPVLTADRASTLPEAAREIAVLARRAGLDRMTLQGSVSGIPLEARPVRASESKCLGCHRGKQVGDPLGVVIYAFGGRGARSTLPR